MYYAIHTTRKKELLWWKGKTIVGTLQGMAWLKGNIKGWGIVEYGRLDNNVGLTNIVGFCEWWLSGGVKVYKLTEEGKKVAKELEE